MPIYLRQSTASQEIPLGYFVDSTDGNTEETALSIANTDIKIWKTGTTTLANKNSGGATHISNGIYHTTLDATDTDTVGPMVIFVHVSGALAVRVECVVLEEAMFDWQFGTAVPLSPTTAGRTLDVSAGGEAGIDWANIGSPTTAVNLSATNIDVDQVVASVSGAVGSVTGAVGSVTGAVGSVTGNVGGNVTGSVGSVVGDVGGNVVGSVASVTARVTANTDQIAGSATPATNLRRGAEALVLSTCAAGSTTTAVETNLTEATDDHYNGRVITFTSGALAGQSSSISDYNGTTKTITCVALTEAPANTDAFVIS